MTTKEEIRSRFPHAPDAVIDALALADAASDEGLDDCDSPCLNCGRWHVSDGLPVPICQCGYCRHMSLTDGKCDYCGVVFAALEAAP